MRQILWSADLTMPGCEVHEGDSCQSGWLDPDWSLFEVGGNRETDAVPTVMPDDVDDPAQWLAEQVGQRIGPVQCHHTDRPGAWMAVDAQQNIETGMFSQVRALAEGFTMAELARANHILSGRAPGEWCCE